jgi:hypothetical protein
VTVSKRRVLIAVIAVLIGAAIVVAVGLSSATSSSAGLGGGANVVPANSVAFIAFDTDVNSSQQQALSALLAKFPGSDGLVAKLEGSIEGNSGLSWTNDIAPALGPEIDIAVLPTTPGGGTNVVLLTQPTDASKFNALVKSVAAHGGSTPVVGHASGWTIVGDSQAAIDQVTGATSYLGSDPAYQNATSQLTQGALLNAYANGAQARQLASGLGQAADMGLGKLVWVGADVVAASDGLKIEGFVNRGSTTASKTYTSSLVGQIPAGALAVVDFQADNINASAKSLPSPTGAALAKFAGMLGGETALYVSSGLPIPSLTLVTHPTDPQAVLDALNAMLAASGSGTGDPTTGGMGLGSMLGSLQLHHAQVGDTLVVSTSQEAVDAFTGSGKKLSDDPTFQSARSASGMPDQTTGFVYLNAKDAIPLVKGLAALSGSSSASSFPDLSALQTVTVYGSGATDGVDKVTFFIEVH